MTEQASPAALKRVLVFGASGHLGGPVADTLIKKNNAVELRLATSSAANVVKMKSLYPSADIVVCNYTDLDEMIAAMNDVDAVFVVTPDFMDEHLCANNIVKAANVSGTVKHIVRIMGDPPNVTMDDVPKDLQKFRDGMGAAVGHQTARRILSESGLNVTFVNVAAYYMDSLSGIWHGRALREADSLVEIKRHYMPYVDPAEVGEACANILLRQAPQDTGATFHLNNSHDMIDFYQVSEMLSESLGRKITYVQGEKLWKKYTGSDLKKKYGEMAEKYFLNYFTWEGEMIKTIFKRQLGSIPGALLILTVKYAPRSLTNKLFASAAAKPGGLFSRDLDELLGRKPKTLKTWISENRHQFERF